MVDTPDVEETEFLGDASSRDDERPKAEEPGRVGVAGVVGSLVLYGQAYRDEFGRVPAVRGATVQVEWGGCVWLSVAALVCAVGASVVLVRTTLRAGLSTR